MAAVGFSLPDGKAEFDDSKASDWHNKYIAAAFTNGIVAGESENIFGVGEKITRQDMAVILYRAAKYKGMTFDSAKTEFSDDTEISDYAQEAVYSLKNAGIINGLEDGAFAPKQAATRAQAAQMIYSAINYKQ